MRRTRRASGLAILTLLVAGSASAGAQRPPRPAGPAIPPGDWPAPGRDEALLRYSPLDQITPATISGLHPVWTFSTGTLRALEGNPLVVGSTLYVETPYPNTVFALDLGRPGAPIKWRYVAPAPEAPGPRPPAGESRPPAVLPAGCCDVGNRGLAYHPSGRIYAPLLDGQLVALDAATGREVWRVRNSDWRTGATLSGAPLVARDLVIVGVAGAEFGVRGYLTAYDALTGRLVWRGYSTGPDTDVLLDGPANAAYSSHQSRDLGVTSWPADGWRRGGGTTGGWLSYDPALDLVYYGTDQPAPANPALRPGDNKWTSAIIARDAGTGRMRWAYQLTPHDQWGYGGANENILADLTVRGSEVKALAHFDRNGFAYELDRATGRVLLAEKFGPANWARAIDLGTGLPQLDPRYAAPATDSSASPRAAPGRATTGICPGSIGAKFLQPAAFSPATSLFYVPLNNLCMNLRTRPAPYRAGELYSGAEVQLAVGPGSNWGRLIAWNAAAATLAWEIREPLAVAGGALATAGGVVFYGTLEGWLKAVDGTNGRELWKFKTPSGIVGNPITFLGPDGRQYVAVLTGVGGWWGSAAGAGFPDLAPVTNPAGVLMVFGL